MAVLIDGGSVIRLPVEFGQLVGVDLERMSRCTITYLPREKGGIPLNFRVASLPNSVGNCYGKSHLMLCSLKCLCLSFGMY